MASEAVKNGIKYIKGNITRFKHFLDLNFWIIRCSLLCSKRGSFKLERFCEAQDEKDVIEDIVDDMQREEVDVKYFEKKTKLKRLISENNSQNVSSQ